MKDKIHAIPVVYITVKAAHFQLPDSLLIAATTPTHGKYMSTNSIKENAISGVNIAFPY
jgi:hypothetical protein